MVPGSDSLYLTPGTRRSERNGHSASGIEAFQDEIDRLGSLSSREREISILVAKGLTNKQIGRHLSISPVTVRHHLTSIFRKVDIGSRFELIVICYRHELVVLESVPGV